MKIFKKKVSFSALGLGAIVGMPSMALADELPVENNSIENSYKLNESTVVSKTEIPRKNIRLPQR